MSTRGLCARAVFVRRSLAGLRAQPRRTRTGSSESQDEAVAMRGRFEECFG